MPPMASDKVNELGLGAEMLNTMKDYVTSNDNTYTRLPEGMVCIHVTHSNLLRRMQELRFDKHMTIAAVKSKLHTHCGTNPANQRLILCEGGNAICPLDDDSKMLGYYSVESGMEIHVIDEDPYSMSKGGGLENTDLIEKYRMSDDAYEKRKGTVREWIKDQRAKDPNWKPPKPNMSVGLGGQKVAPPPREPEGPPPGPEAVEGMAVGMRCQVMPGKRRGAVGFIGEVEGLAAGYWVGVKLDEPVGRNDGSRGDKKYFECEPGFGSFVRPKNTAVGDYPERDLLDDDDDDDEDEVGGDADKPEVDGEEDEDEL